MEGAEGFEADAAESWDVVWADGADGEGPGGEYG
mgnify:CR=1 FL=1